MRYVRLPAESDNDVEFSMPVDSEDDRKFAAAAMVAAGVTELRVYREDGTMTDFVLAIPEGVPTLSGSGSVSGVRVRIRTI